MRVLIVDDEALARSYLEGALADIPNVKVVGAAEDVATALVLVRRERPDLILLDVQLRRESGFDLLAQLPPDDLPAVVFVTAYAEHAIRAFDLHAVDYLLKPFDGARLRVALDRAGARLRGGPEERDRLLGLLEALRAAPRYPDRLLITEGGRIFFVAVASIEAIEAQHNHVVLHAGAKTHLLRSSLTALESRLDPWRFVRIHRSTIVSIDHIVEMQPWFQSDLVVIMRGGRQFRVGRRYRDVWDRWKGREAE
ncbi:MAG: response regulator transcription factor [Gemmatimonadales bacterium]|nr:response regulator transcription factor [Gemmatimonadales bacterium]